MASRLFWFSILLTIIFQAGLSYLAFSPEAGFDDANITQAYARNIANGHGYVYNVGGERVEGSTSALWTAINTVAFLTPFPILAMLAVSFGVTGLVLIISGRIAHSLHPGKWTAALTVLAFNFFPHFFGWGLYSLMDITLFIALIMAAVYFLIMPPKGAWWALPYAVFILLPLARPEGIVVAFGLSLYGVFFAADLRNRIVTYGLAMAASMLSFILITLARVAYFGYPFPNTYYAKTSSDFVGQAKQGTRYLLQWLEQPANALILVLFAALFVLILQKRSRLLIRYGYLVAYLFVSAVLLYTYLGGDHFPGGRFYQFMYPLILPFLVASYFETRSSQQDRPVGFGWANAGILIVFLAFSAFFWVSYYREEGHFGREFRIAERGTSLGNYLSEELPDTYSVGVIAAGGFRMGYSGPVYDVLGLNWVEMAHATGEVNANVLKNHGAFRSEVFLAKTPEIFYPRFSGCANISGGELMGQFTRSLTGHVDQSASFQNLYRPYCNEDVSFYALNSIGETLVNAGFQEIDRE